ncbi:methylthioribulose-1-phosphate dehydratase [Platysternon megacephalum]|uniref:Methylthioribulose-1-phosphate dehydratase n=1 Tax=Platysternon megacephalum TaxID=55544 RepID=A0A4D9EMS5_9SAUR|nr:methylthioribulose-1-phosphate dehydratase [Platysternon megacephalum]
MPMPRRRSSFLGQQPSSSTTESTGATSQRLSIGGSGSLPRSRGVYVGIVPTGGVSSLGTRVSRRALGISSVFLQGLRSSCSTVPLAQGLEKGRGLSYESLNGCLVEYIEKVRALEQVNQELEEHIRVYLEKKSSNVNSWEALRENWESIYHQQTTETAPAVQTQEEDLVESLRAEFHETACKIQSLQAETESLRTLKRGLENSLYDAKHWHDIELQNLGSVITKLEAEVREIRAETEQQQRDRETLLSNKIQLEKDIAAYHCLLDAEERSSWLCQAAAATTTTTNVESRKLPPNVGVASKGLLEPRRER